MMIYKSNDQNIIEKNDKSNNVNNNSDINTLNTTVTTIIIRLYHTFKILFIKYHRIIIILYLNI